MKINNQFYIFFYSFILFSSVNVNSQTSCFNYNYKIDSDELVQLYLDELGVERCNFGLDYLNENYRKFLNEVYDVAEKENALQRLYFPFLLSSSKLDSSITKNKILGRILVSMIESNTGLYFEEFDELKVVGKIEDDRSAYVVLTKENSINVSEGISPILVTVFLKRDDQGYWKIWGIL